jgi:hypothetical protein
MAWPTSPTNGQTVTQNGVIYVYNSSKNAWGVASTAGGDTVTFAGNVASANVNVTGNVYISNQRVPTIVEMLTYGLAL